MSAPKDVFKHPKGSYARLTTTNYKSWMNSSKRTLKAISAWEIVTGREQLPPVLAGNSAAAVTSRTQRAEFVQRRDDAAALIYNSCSDAVRVHIDDIDDPDEMWTVLAERLDSSNTAIGRQALYRRFTELRPTPGAPIDDYFTQLLEIHNQIAGTAEAISDIAFKIHVFSTLPAVFDVTARMQQNMPNATIESILDALKEDERIRQMRSLPDAATEALVTQGQRGFRGGKRRGRSPPSSSLWCSFCGTATHNLVDCRSKATPRRPKGESSNAVTGTGTSTMICYHCAEVGHRVATCPIKRRADEARQNDRKRPRLDAHLGEREADPAL